MTSAAAGCAAARSRFPAYRDETLARDERTAVRDHIGACVACRGEAARFDPVLLFAAMPQETVSAAEAAEILAAVRSGIALKTAEKRIESGARLLSPARRISATAAAVAAAVVLAWTSGPGAALRTAPAGPESPSAARPTSIQQASFSAGLRPSNASPNAPVDAPLETQTQTQAQERTSAGPSAIPFGEASGPAKGNLPADATIYDWNPGGGQPRVVWIVDRSLDI